MLHLLIMALISPNLWCLCLVLHNCDASEEYWSVTLQTIPQLGLPDVFSELG